MVFEGYTKGVNLGGWLSQYAPGADAEHFDSYIKQADIRRIASWDADHVRLPVDYKTLADENGVCREENFRRVDEAIGWCKESGLNVIIDMYEAPGFHFLERRNDLFERTECQDLLVNLWGVIAERYKNEGGNVCYELLNEVNDDTPDRWNALAERLIQVIRAVDTRHYILVGGIRANAANQLSNLKRFDDDKIVGTFHMYHPFIFTHQLADFTPLSVLMDGQLAYPISKTAYLETLQKIGDKMRSSDNPAIRAIDPQWFGVTNQELLQDLDEVGKEYLRRCIDPAVAFAKETELPVYCGEFGVIINADPQSRVNWLRDTTDIFTENGIGYAVWNYRETHFPLVDEGGNALNDGYIKILGGRSGDCADQ